MELSANVRTAFAPLGMRLHFFEASLHLIKDDEHDVEMNRHDFNYIGMIDELGRQANYFDSVEVYLLANEYIDRVIRVHIKLKEEQKKIGLDKWAMWDKETYEYLIH